MSTNTQGNAEKMMQDLGKRLDEVITDLRKLKDNAKVEYADQIDELKRNRDTINKEIEDFREKHKDRLDEVEKRLERAAQELGKAIETAFRKKPSQESKE